MCVDVHSHHSIHHSVYTLWPKLEVCPSLPELPCPLCSNLHRIPILRQITPTATEPSEQAIAAILMLALGAFWAFLVGIFCSCLMTLNPAATEFGQTMASLNGVCSVTLVYHTPRNVGAASGCGVRPT